MKEKKKLVKTGCQRNGNIEVVSQMLNEVFYVKMCGKTHVFPE